jgi:hypothetical protein
VAEVVPFSPPMVRVTCTGFVILVIFAFIFRLKQKRADTRASLHGSFAGFPIRIFSSW